MMIYGINPQLTAKHKWALFALLAVGILWLVWNMPMFLRLVEFLGHRIPQKDVRADYLKGLAWAVFLGATIFIWPIRSRDRKALLWVWSVKCFVMLGLMLFYEYYYQTDGFGYFSGSRHDISEWERMELTGPSSVVVFIAWLHNHSFLDSFHATKVSFGMIGFVAIYIFYRSAVAFLQQEKLNLLYIFAFFPSILFWSSILGKEPIVLLGLSVYSYGVIKLFNSGRFSYIAILLLGVVITAYIRVWMGTILLLPVLISILFSLKKIEKKVATLFILILAFLFYSNSVMRTFNIRSSEDVASQATIKSNNFARGGSEVKETASQATIKSNNFVGGGSEGKETASQATIKSNNFVGGGSEAKETASQATIKSNNFVGDGSEVKETASGNMIRGITGGAAETKKIKYNNLWDMLLFVPRGMFTVLFRPLPGEVNNAFGFLAGMEDSFLLILFVLAVKRARWQELFDPLSIWVILLIVIWAAAYAFVGFNLGTVCRYRLQILPFFLGLLMYMVRSRDSSITLVK